MDNASNENIKFDCSRGCMIYTDAETGESSCTYRQGCCKLEDYNWLKGVRQEQFKDLFEVRFKDTRKGFYVNDSSQSIKTGDLVVVEATNGHDLGIVTLEGPIVGRQMKCKGVDPSTTPLKKIYRRAKPFDIAKWQESIAKEQDTMIQARRIAAELGLEMKIGDVEYQGDGTKAIFYYIADGRVDFRQLIKVFAEEFRIRIEMKQIGARQEAGLIGGLGVCGRELCCANYITNFQSISTSAARVQDLSMNPQKLAGQCGKLKCCLNYEVAAYMDAHSRIPKVTEPLEFEDGQAFLVKTDILRETLYFSYDKNSLANIYPLSAREVQEIIMMNRNGQKPSSLKPDTASSATPEFVSAVGDDSITRFDKQPKRKKKKNKGSAKAASKAQQGGKSQDASQGDQAQGQKTASQDSSRPQKSNNGQQGASQDNSRSQKANNGQQGGKGQQASQGGQDATASQNSSGQNNPKPAGNGNRSDRRSKKRNRRQQDSKSQPRPADSQSQGSASAQGQASAAAQGQRSADNSGSRPAPTQGQGSTSAQGQASAIAQGQRSSASQNSGSNSAQPGAEA